MENFHQLFSSETIKNLENLKNQLSDTDAFPEAARLELFRALHTIKGSAQTFGFAAAGRLAHELESFLDAESAQILANEKNKNLFVEGVNLLVTCLQEKKIAVPTAFIDKVRAVANRDASLPNASQSFSIEIPDEISSQLSNQEKKALISSLSAGKNLYVFEIGFDFSEFNSKFKEFREILSRSGEIFASIPSAKFKQAGKIGFRIVFASFLPTEEIKKIAEDNQAQLISVNSERNFPIDLPGILAQTVEHGKNVAAKLGRQVEFVVSAEDMKLSTERLKLIFDVLLHLTRNSIDHAIKSTGKIEINVKVEKENLKLYVADDGQGIDLQKIKAKAVDKNLISADENLSRQEMLEMIFLPEFSTASAITEISGRGIGLDAVKNAVEKAGGTINVKSASGNGTSFEIFLPVQTANLREA